MSRSIRSSRRVGLALESLESRMLLTYAGGGPTGIPPAAYGQNPFAGGASTSPSPGPGEVQGMPVPKPNTWGYHVPYKP